MQSLQKALRTFVFIKLALKSSKFDYFQLPWPNTLQKIRKFKILLKIFHPKNCQMKRFFIVMEFSFEKLFKMIINQENVYFKNCLSFYKEAKRKRKKLFVKWKYLRILLYVVHHKSLLKSWIIMVVQLTGSPPKLSWY